MGTPKLFSFTDKEAQGKEHLVAEAGFEPSKAPSPICIQPANPRLGGPTAHMRSVGCGEEPHRKSPQFSQSSHSKQTTKSVIIINKSLKT